MKRISLYFTFFLIALLITYLTSFYTYEIRSTTMYIGNAEPGNLGVSGYPLFFQFKDSTGGLVIGQLLVDIFFWFGIVIMFSKLWDLLVNSKK